ncbi:hypothetical protein N657DRAFT_646979 [Parathielavia appendiculata]|uniref:Uncharacterized protein n=1 Tax=Parathielavia appendiculata TaxID=2587402 RepID=A0AAN6TWW2_9PEZI|nr:hypothetical protein N657DRAFT_646979 [Parathielavia appendiculata]
MGLRLYQPPVESDIQSKPATDRSARSRSNIRRVLDRNDERERIRERRRRALAATAAYNNYDARRASALEPVTRALATTDSSGTRSGSEHARRALLVTDRPGVLLRADGTRNPAVLDDRAVTMFGERWAHFESNPNLFRDEDNDSSPMLTMAGEPDFLPRRNQLRPEPTYALSNLRSTQAPGHPSRGATTPHSTLWSRIQRRHRSSMRDESRPSQDDASDRPRPRPPPSAHVPWAIEAADMDGLGDRNRSLSPEGDNLWGTLLTTLTPDPQPPSAGSSFASASASAAATQSTAAASSSRTSFTTPDAAEEFAFEPPCESGCDNSDTEGEGDGEGEDDDEMEQMQLPYFPRLASSNQSYADRARGNNEDPLELLGGIGGMQRIVRNLARREDIPDEWWAEAGLSRTLSREAGN